MQVEVQVFMISARDLKNVNWRNGLLKAYAIFWIDSSAKFSTKVDLDNNANPVWKEKFSIPLPSTSRPETATLHIDVVHANASPNTKPLIGSVKFPLGAVLSKARANGKIPCSLDLNRPSGRPQGILEIKIDIKDQTIPPRDQHGQQILNRTMSPQVNHQPQPRVLPQYQPRPQLFRPSAPPIGPIYAHGYRPIIPTPTQQICNMLLGGRSNSSHGVMKLVAEQYQNALQTNNNNTALNIGAGSNGQFSNGGLGGNGIGPGGFDNGFGFDSNGMGNGFGIDPSVLMGGSGLDVGGILGGVDVAGLMGGLNLTGLM